MYFVFGLFTPHLGRSPLFLDFFFLVLIGERKELEVREIFFNQP